MRAAKHTAATEAKEEEERKKSKRENGITKI